MTKLASYVYEGEHKYDASATTPIFDGAFAERRLNAAGDAVEMFAASAAGAKFSVKEVGDIYEGVKALRLYVEAVDPAKTIYFVEQNDYLDDTAMYDTTERNVVAGKFLRAHPIYVGEEFWSNQVTNIDTATFTVGQQLTGVNAGIIG